MLWKKIFLGILQNPLKFLHLQREVLTFKEFVFCVYVLVTTKALIIPRINMISNTNVNYDTVIHVNQNVVNCGSEIFLN